VVTTAEGGGERVGRTGRDEGAWHTAEGDRGRDRDGSGSHQYGTTAVRLERAGGASYKLDLPHDRKEDINYERDGPGRVALGSRGNAR
jgi:hypothetical protein